MEILVLRQRKWNFSHEFRSSLRKFSSRRSWQSISLLINRTLLSDCHESLMTKKTISALCVSAVAVVCRVVKWTNLRNKTAVRMVYHSNVFLSDSDSPFSEAFIKHYRFEVRHEIEIYFDNFFSPSSPFHLPKKGTHKSLPISIIKTSFCHSAASCFTLSSSCSRVSFFREQF